MRYLRLTAPLIFVIFLASCTGNNIFREFHKFDKYTWGRFDKVKFEIPIKEDGLAGEIVLTIRHVDNFPYDELPVYAVLTTPTGEERIVEVNIKFKDENKEFKGEVAGNLWDIEEVLWKTFFFNNTGTYTIELENLHPRVGVPGLVDLGIVIKKK